MKKMKKMKANVQKQRERCEKIVVDKNMRTRVLCTHGYTHLTHETK